jgi:nicotinate-nucleotide pyrophosphorylase (carboxylating)
MVEALSDVQFVRPLVDAALAEDVGNGDATSEAVVSGSARARAEIVVKQPGVVCGLAVARLVFERVDPLVGFEADAADGDAVEPPRVVARLHGPTRAILTGERTALNFLQHLSGIATATAAAVAALRGTPTRILDTRKTLPGMRYLAKYAVRCGGGVNHRRGLYDMLLIKENHVAAAGGIGPAIRRARDRRPDLNLEVEVRSLDELEEALDGRPDRVMLDNFTPERVREAMGRMAAREDRTGEARPEVELSGGITPATIGEFASSGADFISSGAITHSVTALDISLEILT